MHIPQFFFVPTIPNNEGAKVIIHTPSGYVWQVHHFNTVGERYNFINQKNFSAIATVLNLHKKYPYLLVGVGKMNQVLPDLPSEKIVSIGNRASDWYAQFWFEEIRRQKAAPDDGAS